MYAVIETGGKQYRVQEGDVITVEKLDAKEGGKVVFDKVLVFGEGADVQVGTPYLEGVQVSGKVLEHGKGKKVIAFKYKAKKDSRSKQGHRQPYTMVEISLGAKKTRKSTKKAAPAEAEAPAVEAAPAEAEA